MPPPNCSIASEKIAFCQNNLQNLQKVWILAAFCDGLPLGGHGTVLA